MYKVNDVIILALACTSQIMGTLHSTENLYAI